MNKRKKLIIFYVSIIVVMLVSIMYVSYGYMLTKMIGNETGKSFAALSQLLKIEYSDGTETLTSNSQGYFIPGSVITKTFTITNKGNVDVYYNILLDEIINPFTRKEDLEYELYLDDQLISSDTFPDKTTEYIGYSIKIEENTIQNFILKIYYNNSTENQIVDKNKVISGKLAFEQNANQLNKYMVYATSRQGNNLFNVGLESGSLLNTSGSTFSEQLFVDNSRVRTSTPVIIEKNTNYILVSPVTNTIGLRLYDENGACTTVNAPGMGSKQYTFNSGENTSLAFSVVGLTDVNVKYELYAIPSPTNPIEIKNMGKLITDENDSNFGKYKIDLIAMGKNLFDISKITTTNYIKNNNDGTLTVPKQGPYKTVETLQEICPDLKAGDSIAFSLKTTGTKNYIWFYSANPHSWIDGRKYTVTQDDLDTPLAFYDGDISMIQVEIVDPNSSSSTATEYEIYEKITKSLYLNEPLRCIDSSTQLACDYIDMINRNLVRTTTYKEFDENNTWSLYSSSANHFQVTTENNLYSNTSNYILSNYFPANKNNNTYYYSGDYGVMSVDGNRIRFKNKDLSTIEEWKAWLSGVDPKLQVIYALKTPTTEKIDDLPYLSNIVGKNIYLTDGELYSTRIEVE